MPIGTTQHRAGIGQSGAVCGDAPTFEQWLQEITFNPASPADDQGEVSAGWRQWLRHFFEREGPVSQAVVTQAAMRHQVALANDAVTAVLADLHRTTAFRPVVEVDVWMEGSIRISIDGGFTTPSMWEVEQPQAFAEVADYVQEQMGQKLGRWPVCGLHDVGLHPEVHGGRAVWWCRTERHAVAPIGELGATH
jgi:hypothetical protein